MDYFYRLIRQLLALFVGLFLLAVPFLSFAETIQNCPGDGFCYTSTVSVDVGVATAAWKVTNGGYSYTNTNVITACNVVAANAFGNMDWQATQQWQGQCDMTRVANGSGSMLMFSVSGVSTCASGTVTNGRCYEKRCPSDGLDWSKVSDSQCRRPTCPPDKVEINGVCVTNCPAGTHRAVPDNGTCINDCFGEQVQSADGSCKCEAGGSDLVSYQLGGGASGPGAGGCFQGCMRTVGQGFCPSGPVAAVTGGSATCYAYSSKTGATCGGGTTIPITLKPPTTMPPADTSGTNKGGTAPDPLNTTNNAGDPVQCGQAGGAWGSYNGVGKCLMPDSNNGVQTVKTDTTTTKNSDNTTTEKTTTTTTTNNGSSGPETVTSTTTTTTKDGNGNVTGTTTTTTSGTKGGFCQENPNASICKDGKFGGSCEGGFTCDGDPVQCATAKATWEHRCQMKWSESSNGLSELVTNAATTKGADEDKALNKDGSGDIDVWQKFQENQKTYLTFTKNCPASANFSLRGRTYTFDFAPLCQLGLLMSILLRLGAYMILLRMFMRLSTS